MEIGSPVQSHPALGRLAVELEQSIRERTAERDAQWAAFERAVLEHMHVEEVELLAGHAVSHRAEVEALLAEHHEIRCALLRGRAALATEAAREALLAISSFRMHQIREETGVYQHLALHAH